MPEDSVVIDLLNNRFDDIKDQIADLKADMLRETESIKDKHKEHEVSDNERHEAVQARLISLDKIKWTVTGAASLAFVIVHVVEKVLEHFFTS